MDNLGKIVCIVGPNGTGKSSLLELINKTVGASDGGSFASNESKLSGDDVEIEIAIDEGPQQSPISGEEMDTSISLVRIHAKNNGSSSSGGSHGDLRKSIVMYPSSRSFAFRESAGTRPPRDGDEVYRQDGATFQNRADLLLSKLTAYLTMERDDLARTVIAANEQGKKLDTTAYVELQIVRNVFESFFDITGKTHYHPTSKPSGQTEFLFSVPWSQTPLPISYLSSGEQWILLFFVEMELNNWTNHIILIDEIETHLHPALAERFIRALESREDSNQYWLTTHSPTIAQYLQEYTIGLITKEDKTVERVSSDSLRLLESLTGKDGMIPVAKTIVLLEGTKLKGERYSVDETLFSELQRIGAIPRTIQFTSVGTSQSVEEFRKRLEAVEKGLGIGWKIYAIRDRDALPTSIRKQIISDHGDKLWIWERNSLEGYMLEPEVLHRFFESENIEDAPTKKEIEDTILSEVKKRKDDLLKRYEQQIVFHNLPSRSQSSLQWLNDASDYVPDLRTELNSFREQLEKWIEDGDWIELLPYVNCKELLQPIMGIYLGRKKVPTEPSHLTSLLRHLIRGVFSTEEKNGVDKLALLWPEISEVLSSISTGGHFKNLI